MKRIGYILISLLFCLVGITFNGCDVHEWPIPKECESLCLRLNYMADMTEWHYRYNDSKLIEEGPGSTYRNGIESGGRVRHIVRAYPQSEDQGLMQEFIFEEDIKEGYIHEIQFDIIPGEYEIKVWSDFVGSDSETYFYQTDDFGRINLLGGGQHKGNTDYRDAFRGSCNVSVQAGYIVMPPDTLDVIMQRPLAKFELITDDIDYYIERSVENYMIKFFYVGFMPSAYSIFTDKPVDSITGVIFESSLSNFSENTATMGFDYIFLRDEQSSTTIQYAVYDEQGNQILLSKHIEIPIKRNFHTKVTGSFLTGESSEGTLINPGYNGDHNLVFP